MTPSRDRTHRHQRGLRWWPRPRTSIWPSFEVFKEGPIQKINCSFSWTSSHCSEAGQSCNWALCREAELACKLQATAHLPDDFTGQQHAVTVAIMFPVGTLSTAYAPLRFFFYLPHITYLFNIVAPATQSPTPSHKVRSDLCVFPINTFYMSYYK